MSLRKKPKTTTQKTSLLSLPDDLLFNCIARVSRTLYYPTLSLVSKCFGSLITSPGLYKTRSLLGRTESCLYVCINSHYDKQYRWFTLCRKPNQTLTNDKKKSSQYVLVTVPVSYSPPAYFPGLVAVGSDIYNIGGSLVRYMYDLPSSHSSPVSILDCTSHTWREGPSLEVELRSLAANVVDEKIYVAKTYKDDSNDSWKESVDVWDTTTREWNPVPPTPFANEPEKTFYLDSACIDGKFHVKNGIYVAAYDSKEGRWDNIPGQHNGYSMFDESSYCVIDNVVYSAFKFNRGLRWYDMEARTWRDLMGLVGLPRFSSPHNVRLADYGGKMAILWDEVSFSSTTKIWCAVITLERCQNCEILGKVEWCDHVLTVSYRCNLVKALVVTI